VRSPSGTSVYIHVDDAEEPPHSDRIDRSATAALVRHILDAEGIEQAEVSLVFCGDGRISGLNGEWLNREGPTDVIAFGLGEVGEEERGIEGEVYIDLVQAARQAPEYGATLDEEVRRLVVHGILHLLGYDDLDEGARTRMHARQEVLVDGWSQPLLSEVP
jgi:probable rRNA maturation factor